MPAVHGRQEDIASGDDRQWREEQHDGTRAAGRHEGQHDAVGHAVRQFIAWREHHARDNHVEHHHQQSRQRSGKNVGLHLLAVAVGGGRWWLSPLFQDLIGQPMHVRGHLGR